jgi:hypothetical protein
MNAGVRRVAGVISLLPRTSTALEVGGDFRFERADVCGVINSGKCASSRGLSLMQAKRRSGV